MSNQYINTKNRRSINGPTAAVLKYGANQGAPVVVAQGSGLLAEKIINTAKRNNVLLQEDSTLLGNLLDIDLGDSIPPQLYGVIAEIMILLEKAERD